MEDHTTTPPARAGTTKTPKSAGKSTAATESGSMPPLINPVWAAEIVKKQDVMGKTAELAVALLTSAIEKQVLKATKPDKLDKLVWSAITEAHRKARG